MEVGLLHLLGRSRCNDSGFPVRVERRGRLGWTFWDVWFGFECFGYIQQVGLCFYASFYGSIHSAFRDECTGLPLSFETFEEATFALLQVCCGQKGPSSERRLGDVGRG